MSCAVSVFSALCSAPRGIPAPAGLAAMPAIVRSWRKGSVGVFVPSAPRQITVLDHAANVSLGYKVSAWQFGAVSRGVRESRCLAATNRGCFTLPQGNTVHTAKYSLASFIPLVR